MFRLSLSCFSTSFRRSPCGGPPESLERRWPLGNELVAGAGAGGAPHRPLHQPPRQAGVGGGCEVLGRESEGFASLVSSCVALLPSFLFVSYFPFLETFPNLSVLLVSSFSLLSALSCMPLLFFFAFFFDSAGCWPTPTPTLRLRWR